MSFNCCFAGTNNNTVRDHNISNQFDKCFLRTPSVSLCTCMHVWIVVMHAHDAWCLRISNKAEAKERTCWNMSEGWHICICIFNWQVRRLAWVRRITRVCGVKCWHRSEGWHGLEQWHGSERLALDRKLAGVIMVA